MIVVLEVIANNTFSWRDSEHLCRYVRRTGIWSTKNLDAVYIVEWAVVLHIITTIDKEVRSRANTAENNGVTVTFTLRVFTQACGQ